MVIVLMQDKVYAIDDFPAKVREKFPNTSILEVNKSCVRERLEQSKLTPLLTDGWAVIMCLLNRLSLSVGMKGM